jgi:hypothetical protein
MKIRINQYAFSIPLRFRAGHELSQNEADALNGLRAENIRNNVKRWIDEATKGLPPGELLTPDALSALQDRVSEYARDYEFGPKGEPKGGIRKTAFEIELLAIATSRVEEQARAMDITLSEEGFAEAVESQMKLAIVIEEARRRVSARQELAQQALQSLLE